MRQRELVVDGHDEAPVEEPVASFAGGLGDEQAGMAGGAVQEVGGCLRQPFGTQRVRRAAESVTQGSLHDAGQRLGLGQRHQAAQGALGVGHGGVDEDAALVLARVDPLGQAGRAVAALQRDRPDQQVGQGVQRDVAGLRPAVQRVEVGSQPAGVAVGPEPPEGFHVLADHVRVADAGLPGGHQGRVDAQEDPFPADLAGRDPGRAVAGQRRARHQVGVLRVGRVQPGEPGQGADLAQPLGLGDVGQESGQRGGHALAGRGGG